jgi:glycosyltransferase involved in cell wall biosynthesis
MENEIRRKIPMVYLNIWDDLPAPLYNRPYYESCDALLAISKQTLNINKLVLGSKTQGKVLKYVPHGINSDLFYPVTSEADQKTLAEFRTKILKGRDSKFTIFFNSRNIRRKSLPDLFAAYKLFCDEIGKEKAKDCTLLLHTDAIDENGTNLLAVRDLLCDPEYMNITFTEGKFAPPDMKFLYNLADVTVLPSSNEGWGLSLTESLMCGKMIIANVTGGMQDQMRFEDEDGNWIDFDENFCSNHFGTYQKCGEWAVPVFPSNMSMVGSVPTPYIWDDRLDFRDLAKAIKQVYDLTPEERQQRGLKGREWAISDEAGMSGTAMGKNVIEGIEETLKVWKPRKNYEFIKAGKLPINKIPHKLVY